MELWTCRRGETLGTRLRIRGGQTLETEHAGTAAGCRIEVRDLFFSTPARRKFLKAPATEAGHVSQLVGRFALAHPEIAFRLSQDGRETLSLPPGDRRERIRRVLGREIEAELRPIVWQGAVRISGFATHPHFTTGSSRTILLFVNGRLVRDRLLQHALLAAYATLVPRGRYPAAVVFLEVDPEEVDVNVHPAKLEVRFREPHAVHEAIGRALRSSLGRGTPGGDGAETRVAEATATYAHEPTGTWDLAATTAGSRLRLVPTAPGRNVEPGLFPEGGPFSSLQVVGQVFDGYLVCQGDGEIVLIDQHAAHERVAFERLSAARRTGRVEVQAMLVPQPVEVGAGAPELLSAAGVELSACGLEVEPFGERTVVVRSVPALLPPEAIAPLLRAIASDLAEVERTRAVEERSERLLATIACHSVVRVGQKLSEAEMRALLAAMDSVDLNSNCPHGRPVSRRISRGELERRFGR